jgi:hypothetical protein
MTRPSDNDIVAVSNNQSSAQKKTADGKDQRIHEHMSTDVSDRIIISFEIDDTDFFTCYVNRFHTCGFNVSYLSNLDKSFTQFLRRLLSLKTRSEPFVNLPYADSWDCDLREEVWICDCTGWKLV